MRRLIRRLLIAVFAAALLLTVGHALGATYGIQCYFDTNRARNLLNAIEEANHNNQDDWIYLVPGCVYNLPRPLVIEADDGHLLTIDGRGSSIAGNFTHRVIEIRPEANTNLRNLTVRSGYHRGSGGGIFNEGVLEGYLLNVRDNEAQNGAGLYNASGATAALSGGQYTNNRSTIAGGAIFNGGDLQLSQVVIQSNTAHTGGGLSNREAAVIENSIVRENHASGYGAGVHNFQGTLTVIQGVFEQNGPSAPDSVLVGGAIMNGFGRVEVQRSFFRENEAWRGGALVNNGGILDLVNSIVRNNTANSASGGAALYQADGLSYLSFATLFSNLSSGAGAGSIYISSGAASMQGVILQNSQCVIEGAAEVTDSGGNLENDNTCQLEVGYNTSAMLNTSDIYLPPETGSPAIDRVQDCRYVTDYFNPLYNQVVSDDYLLKNIRISRIPCDSGAIEFTSPPITPTWSAGTGTIIATATMTFTPTPTGPTPSWVPWPSANLPTNLNISGDLNLSPVNVTFSWSHNPVTTSTHVAPERYALYVLPMSAGSDSPPTIFGQPATYFDVIDICVNDFCQVIQTITPAIGLYGRYAWFVAGLHPLSTAPLMVYPGEYGPIFEIDITGTVDKSATPTFTPTNTLPPATATPSLTPSSTPTPVYTLTLYPSPTPTLTVTPSMTPTVTRTPTPTNTRPVPTPVSDTQIVPENALTNTFQTQIAAGNGGDITFVLVDFVPGEMRLSVQVEGGVVGNVTVAVDDTGGFASLRVTSITVNGAPAPQSYATVVSRDLPPLLIGSLDALFLSQFAYGRRLESLTIDGQGLTATFTDS